MDESGFNIKSSGSGTRSIRQPIGPENGRYIFFKVRRYGKLHFEKRVAPKYIDDILTAEALKKEFELGYGLEHPSIVKYLAYEDNSIFEEFIDGFSLREMIEKEDSRLNNPLFIENVCRSVLKALDYLHKKGIVHLDVKPENVMVNHIGNDVKLIDLGSARSGMFDNTEGFTSEYGAPEQIQGLATDIRTDIYLVGRMMQELTSQSPLRETWKDFILVATNDKPSLRYSSASEAFAAIPKVKTDERSQKVSPPPIPVGSETKTRQSVERKSAWKWWSVAAAIAVVIGVSIYWFRDDKTRQRGIIVGSTDTEHTLSSAYANNPDMTSDEFKQAADLIKGVGGVQDEAEGMRLMMIAAENGDAMAQCYIGLMYRDGCSSLQRDFSKSLYWIRNSAEKGNPIAIEEMGYKYYEGLGVEKNYAEALKWFEKAAEKGKDTAYSSIGIMYRDGLGVEKDFSKAEENFLKGATAGNSYSAYLLGCLYGHYMSPIEPQKAMEWYVKASDMGSFRATELLKKIYTEGEPSLNVAPDSVLAAKYSVRYESSNAQ